MKDLGKKVSFRRNDGGLDSTKIIEALETAMTESRIWTEHKVKKSFSPSTVGFGHGTCPRYWHLAFQGAEFVSTMDPQGAANMDNGIHSHDRLQKLWEKTGMLVEAERTIITEDPPIFGFADLVVKLDDDGEDLAIGEIKTSRSEAFIFRQSTMKPYDSHLLQVLLYMWAEDIERGFIQYENKNTHEFLILPVEKTEKNKAFLRRVIEWMRTVRKNFDEQEEENANLPIRPVTRKNAKICKSCPVYNVCWDGPSGTQNLPVLEVKA